MKLPQNLLHKPIVTVNDYNKIDSQYIPNMDVRALSISQATRDNNQISLKVKNLIQIVMLLIATFFVINTAFSQSVTLKFTGRDASNHYVQLNRVVITNLTKGWQENIFWPDTILSLQNGTGIDESMSGTGFVLSQNTPNPFNGQTEVTLFAENGGETTLAIYDLYGRLVASKKQLVEKGHHRFKIQLATAQGYLLTASCNGQQSSIKMVNNGSGYDNDIKYIGINNDSHIIKGISNKPFTFGDNMEYVGYAYINGTLKESNRINQTQNSSQTLILQFMPQGGQSCPNAATVADYDGNMYNTVQIGDQCWMKENLRTTHYSNGQEIPLGDSTFSINTAYRYYPANLSFNVIAYGYLYNWKAVMRYSSSSSANPSGVQGICPDGWHVPSDAEWTQLANYVSSQSQYVCGNYNANNPNIAKALASTSDWWGSSNTCAVGNNQSSNNATGFTACPAGCCSGLYDAYVSYTDLGLMSAFWSATEDGSGNYDSVLFRYFYNEWPVMFRGSNDGSIGYSVRCLRN